jgi:hypothetical protein
MLVKYKAVILTILLILNSLVSLCACTIEADNYPLQVDDGSIGESGFCNNKAGNNFSLGILFIRNKGHQPITINKVTLLNPENMTVIETALMVIGDESTLIGFQFWPPTSTEDYPNLDTRMPVDGAVIKPGDGYNLIVAVKLTAEKAYASGLEIEYEAGGTKYKEKSYYAYSFNNDGLPSEPTAGS